MISLYRIFAIIVLYLVLGGILTYAFVMGFYAVSSSWAAPVILSAVDEKSLDFRQKLVTSQQSIEDLKVDSQKMQSGIAEMTLHRTALLALEPQLQNAIARERRHNNSTGPQLAALDSQKQADNVKTQAVLAQLKQIESNINRDLATGLITKGDAAAQLSSLNQAANAYTDSKIAEVLLTDNVLQKTTTGTSSLDVLQKQAELRSEVAQLDVAINVAQKELQEDWRQIDRLRQAITTAEENPCFLNAVGAPGLVLRFRSLRQPGQCGGRAPCLRLLPQHDRVPESRYGEAALRRRGKCRPSDLQDQYSRLPDSDESGPHRLREIQDRVPWPQAAFVLRRTECP